MRRLLIAALVGVLSVMTVAANPASADTIDSFTLSPASMPGGSVASITATATWTATSTEARAIEVAVPAPLVGVATWTSVLTSPPQSGCFPEAPAGAASCLWRPAAAGEVLTFTAVLSVPASASPGAYELTARADPEATNGALTATLTIVSAATPAISVMPTNTTPGSTTTASGTFTALTTGDIVVLVDLEGTSGNGTFGSPVAASGLEDCVLNQSMREYRCTWKGATIGDTRSITVPVVVGSGATPGQTWTLNACANLNTAASQCATTTLSIVAPASPTPTATATATASPTPTATATPTPTPTATATAPSSAKPSSTSAPDESEVDALPTAVPAGEGPGGGGSGAPVSVLALAALGVIGALGLTAWRARRDG